jgi:hypothetical protein
MAMANGGTWHGGTTMDQLARREADSAEAGKSMAELTMTRLA